MIVRSASVLALLALLGAGPASAQDSVTPSSVLAGKGAHGFSDRTARISSIMGPEFNGAGPIRLPLKPVWQRPVRRDADASAGLR